MLSNRICPLRLAAFNSWRANGSIIASLWSNGFFNNRLNHCSRMSCRSVSNGNKLASSTVFGVCPSIIAPTARDNLLTTVLRSFG